MQQKCQSSASALHNLRQSLSASTELASTITALAESTETAHLFDSMASRIASFVCCYMWYNIVRYVGMSSREERFALQRHPDEAPLLVPISVTHHSMIQKSPRARFLVTIRPLRPGARLLSRPEIPYEVTCRCLLPRYPPVLAHLSHAT